MLTQLHLKARFFNNLLSNSLKFTDYDGKIKIDLDVTDDEVKVYFSDNGIGMDNETQKYIFRSDVKTTRLGLEGEKGTGLGLPILYFTLQEMDAEVIVESKVKVPLEKDHGTRFTMIFKK